MVAVSVSAIVFTDIHDSSKLWRSSAAQMAKALKKHNDLVARLSKKHKGMIVKGMGDAFMIHFPNPLQSIRFALDLQTTMISKPIVVKGREMELRVGIGIGKPNKSTLVIQGCRVVDYFGPIVNIASRMESKVAKLDGFAFHIEKGVPARVLESVLESVLDEINSHSSIVKRVTTIEFKEKCPKGRKRSGSTQCRRSATLHGVGNLVAYSVELY